MSAHPLMESDTMSDSVLSYYEAIEQASADMLNAARAVDEVVDLPFKHRLKVLLHLPSSHFDYDPQVRGALRGNIREIRSDDLDLSVSDLLQFCHVQIFEGAAVLAT